MTDNTEFKQGLWNRSVDVRDFIQLNYTPYSGDGGFLSAPSDNVAALTEKYEELLALEKAKGGVLDIDTSSVSSLLTYQPGYVDKDKEIIVGLQTDSPLKRGVNPFGGMRMAEQSCRQYGYELSDTIYDMFKYKTTHNDGVFRVYTPEMRKARKCGIITGLPDAYGRGRIIGDYRRVALYGTDFLFDEKMKDRAGLGKNPMTEENIRLLEEIYRQIDFINKLREMALMYDIDISKPAQTAKEAVQWTYFAYLAAIKEQNGAAMSLGRVSTFFDIYFERDLNKGIINEVDAQEIIDQFVLKLRLARELRTPDYNELFAGDPMWITEALGGMGEDGRTLVTKTTFRFLHTLYNLKPSPEPNLTVLWSKDLPEPFKKYCAKISIDTDSIQYENDDVMRPYYGDDYGISCCVSAMKIGKQMQFFGARCNIAKVLLMALNGGRDEISGDLVGPQAKPMVCENLSYEAVSERFKEYIKWLCALYVNTMNVIHYMHDKYAYEKIQMALHDTSVERLMAFGIAGLSVAADSLSAIKYAKVKPIVNPDGIISDFAITGDFPKFGNDDDRVDSIAKELVSFFYDELCRTPAYRGAKHTLSVLTITSNVVYGKKTGSTPDGRKAGEPFAPGANPMHGRDSSGALASLNSVAKIPYCKCMDGVSCTFSIVPSVLGGDSDTQSENLVSIIDGYFLQNAQHINVNVLDKNVLLDAIEHPEKYPTLTIRVSGYAVRFNSLTDVQKREVIARAFHEKY